MSEKKFNKILTIILIVVVVAIIVVGIFWGVFAYKKNVTKKDYEQAANNVFSRSTTAKRNNVNEADNNEVASLDLNMLNSEEDNTNTTTGTRAKQVYKGYAVAGKIEIPKTGLKSVVLDRSTKASMEVAVGIAYGPGLNKVGNTVILGHNYRNGTFFSDNKKLENGDLIYITDSETGTRLKYVIYNTYIAGSDEFDYATRDTAGKREISLSTCTDDVKNRLIIWAKEAE